MNSSDVTGKSPQDGPAARTQMIFPFSVDDLAAHAAAYLTAGTGVGAPGFTIDNRSSGQPAHGGVTAVGIPVVLVASGTGGTITAFVRLAADGTLIIRDKAISPTKEIQLSMADIPAGSPIVIKARELPECDIISGTATPGFRYYICSDFTTTSGSY